VKEESITPYLTRLSATTVRMTDPGTTDPSRTRLRQSLASSTAEYTFSHVFQPETNQPSFFSHTTLPLVRDLLIEGSNALLFAYGVSNSGKTYTVQGGKKKGEAGILPRAFDVLFNSIGDLQGDGHVSHIKVFRLSGLSSFIYYITVPSSSTTRCRTKHRRT
jgi:kinesin family protein 20